MTRTNALIARVAFKADKRRFSPLLTVAIAASLLSVLPASALARTPFPAAVNVPLAARPLSTMTDLQNDSAWASAATVDHFVNVVGGGPIVSRTRCEILRTQVDLAIRCTGFGATPPREPQGGDIMKGDYFVVALYDGVVKSQPVQHVFIIGPENAHVAHGDGVSSWNPEWLSAVDRTPVAWTAYLLLPIRSLVPSGGSGRDWRIAILRSNKATGEVEVWPYVASRPPLSFNASASLNGVRKP